MDDDVISVKNPILKFNGLLDESERNEKKGLMQCYCGAVTGWRNPRAHTIVQDNFEKTREYIVFISLPTERVDKATKQLK